MATGHVHVHRRGTIGIHRVLGFSGHDGAVDVHDVTDDDVGVSHGQDVHVVDDVGDAVAVDSHLLNEGVQHIVVETHLVVDAFDHPAVVRGDIMVGEITVDPLIGRVVEPNMPTEPSGTIHHEPEPVDRIDRDDVEVTTLARTVEVSQQVFGAGEHLLELVEQHHAFAPDRRQERREAIEVVIHDDGGDAVLDAKTLAHLPRRERLAETLGAGQDDADRTTGVLEAPHDAVDLHADIPVDDLRGLQVVNTLKQDALHGVHDSVRTYGNRVVDADVIAVNGKPTIALDDLHVAHVLSYMMSR